MRQPIRNWPITSVSSVTVNGQAMPQSTSIQVWGWVVDGDGKFISLRGGYAPGVATFQNYQYQGGRYGYGAGVQGPGFCAGIQNVEIIYTAGFASVPFDLEMMARKVVSLNYKRARWIGQRMQAMAQGAGQCNTTNGDGHSAIAERWPTMERRWLDVLDQDHPDTQVIEAIAHAVAQLIANLTTKMNLLMLKLQSKIAGETIPAFFPNPERRISLHGASDSSRSGRHGDSWRGASWRPRTTKITLHSAPKSDYAAVQDSDLSQLHDCPLQ